MGDTYYKQNFPNLSRVFAAVRTNINDQNL